MRKFPKFLGVLTAMVLASAVAHVSMVLAQAKQTSATLKVTCMSDGTIKIDSDAAPR